MNNIVHLERCEEIKVMMNILEFLKKCQSKEERVLLICASGASNITHHWLLPKVCR